MINITTPPPPTPLPARHSHHQHYHHHHHHPHHHLTKSSYPERSARKDEYIKHSVDGRPHCKHCQKQFSSWPACMSHFNQRACRVLHMLPKEATLPAASNLAHGTHASETDAAEDDSVRIFHRSDTIAIAKQGLIKPLATHVRGLSKQSYCPECGPTCKTPMYVSRHATKLHACIHQRSKCGHHRLGSKQSSSCQSLYLVRREILHTGRSSP